MDLHGGAVTVTGFPSVPVTELEMKFADGDYLFALRIPQLAELQEKCHAGIFTIYGRVLRGRYIVDGEIIGLPHEGEAFSYDLYETIRLALIGGGRGVVDGKTVEVNAVTARELVERYIHPAPLREAWTFAAAILAAKVEGYQPAKKKAPVKPARKARTAST